MALRIYHCVQPKEKQIAARRNMQSATPATPGAMTAVTADLACLDVASNAKGQKTAAIIRDGQPAFWTISSPATPLFAPSAYKGVSGQDSSGRLSLCLNAGPDVLAEADALDTWCKSYATLHSDRLFGKALTAEQVADRYNGIVKRSDKYPPFLKMKISTDRNAPNFWDQNKQKRDAPEMWQMCQMLCKARIYGMWFMGTSFGLTVQLSDAQITEEGAFACPF